jgi:integrase
VSLYRRGRIWWIELTAQSGRVRESAGTADKKAAQEYHEKRKGEIWRRDRLGEAEPVTWGEAVAKWLKLKARSLPERYMLAAIGIDPKAKLPITKEWYERFSSTRSPSTTARYWSMVVAIHNACGVEPPEVIRRRQPPGRTRWLTSEEWDRLRKCLEEESPLLRQCAEFTLATGLRENNVLELEWSQIDRRRRVAWLHGDQMKAKVPLGVPLNDAALAILEARRDIHKRWVFGNPDVPLTKASNRAWYTALRRARLRGFRWHDLRHTWASWAVMSGVRLEELQRMGGWLTPSMVQRYAHLSSEHLADAAAKVKPVSLRYNAPKAGGKRTKTPTMGA